MGKNSKCQARKALQYCKHGVTSHSDGSLGTRRPQEMQIMEAELMRFQKEAGILVAIGLEAIRVTDWKRV